jgi:hypothetical protein
VQTAGLRGVTRIQTPSGAIDVNPDSSVVRQMDARVVDAVAVDAFVRGGRLGAQLPVKEETTP